MSGAEPGDRRGLEAPWKLVELADVCNVSRSYLWKAIAAGTLAVHRRGRVVRVAAPEARRFARSLGAVPVESEGTEGTEGTVRIR